MSLHINRFIDRLRSAESRQMREVTMTVNEARDLQADITKLLLALETLRNQTPHPTSAPASEIEIDGGNF
jgi:hypothetical protein